MPLAIVIAAGLIAGAIIISGGVYEFNSPRGDLVHRGNKLTGSVYICSVAKHCIPFDPDE